MWVGARATQPATREFVVNQVTALEGFKDDVLIDMVIRRLADAPTRRCVADRSRARHTWPKNCSVRLARFRRSAFEDSISVLMGERANAFADKLSHFLGLAAEQPAVSSNAPSSPTPTD